LGVGRRCKNEQARKANNGRPARRKIGTTATKRESPTVALHVNVAAPNF
jgi:hypothetical protein